MLNIYKIFGPMAHCTVKLANILAYLYRGTNRHERFLNRNRCQENYVCQALITQFKFANLFSIVVYLYL